MSSNSEPDARFRFSLKTLLIVLVVVGVGTGLLGRLFFRNLQVFLGVVGVLSTVVPYVLAVGTILWIGFRRRRFALVAWGGLLLAVPILGSGAMYFAQRYAGPSPGGLGVMTTQQLLQIRLPAQIDEPWVWNELERRLRAGSLSQREVDAAVRQLTAHMTSTRPQGWKQPLSWQDDFLKAATQADLVSNQSLFDLCDAFFGPQPTVQILRVREGDPRLKIEIEYGNTWSQHSGLGVELLWEIDRVLLDGKPLEVTQNSKHGQSWSGYHDGSFKAGDYEITVDVNCAYIDRSKLIGLNADSLPKQRWPKARKRWRQTVSSPLKIYSNVEQMVPLVTDPNRAPTGEVSIDRLVVQVDREGQKKIILNIKITDGLTIPLSCDVALAINDEMIQLGKVWVFHSANSRTSSGTQLQGRMARLDPTIRHAHVILTPNPEHIEHRPEVTEIWGKKIVLQGIPIERFDLEIERLHLEWEEAANTP